MIAIIESSNARRRFFLATVAVLAAVPALKLGDVQALEVFLLLHLVFLAVCFVLAGFRCRVYWPWRRLGIPYGVFLFLTLLLALASFRFRFYPPPDISILKEPFILSVARVTEIALGAFYMVYLAAVLRDEPANRIYAMKVYFWAGFVTALYSLACYPLVFATHLELGVYGWDFRARGGFNEGGPYGLYLVSVMIVGLILYKGKALSKRQVWVCGAILLLTLGGSQSKAAFLAGGLLFLLNLIMAGTLRQRVTLAAVAMAAGIAVWTLTPFVGSIAGYARTYELAQQFGGELSEQQADGIGGRVAGALLVPRMIAAHPITGIGLGNFSLLRNDPDYLRGLPALDTWELPGIGLVAYIAELGIPLFAYLMVLICMPAWIMRKQSSALAFVLAAYQPLAHVFGVQLNFYYPWIGTAFALSTPELRQVLRRKVVVSTKIKVAEVRASQSLSNRRA
jgi:hypothetical protein